MDPAKTISSPEKLAEIEAKMMKSKEKYERLNREIGLENEQRRAMMKEGRIFFRDNQDQIYLLGTYSLRNTQLAVMEYFPEQDENLDCKAYRYFYTASATVSKREEYSERVAKGYLGYRLKKYMENYCNASPFTGQFVVARSIMGSLPLYDKDGTINFKAHKVLEKVVEAYFVSHYASGEDMDGNRLPSTLIKAFR